MRCDPALNMYLKQDEKNKGMAKSDNWIKFFFNNLIYLTRQKTRKPIDDNKICQFIRNIQIQSEFRHTCFLGTDIKYSNVMSNL